MDPPSSARTVASRCGRSSPERIGPTTIVPGVTDTTFSWPIWTAAGVAGVAAFSASVVHAAAASAAASESASQTGRAGRAVMSPISVATL